jgi:hypothetical protein
MAKSEYKGLKEKFELYIKVVGLHPEIELKGKSMPYTSANGYMFSHLSKEGKMGLRLGDTDREKFLEKYDTVLFEQHGRVMKEFVQIPDSMLEDTESLVVYLKNAYDYVMSLKPK